MKINEYVEFYFDKHVVSGIIVSLDHGIKLKTSDGFAVIKNTDAILFYKIKEIPLQQSFAKEPSPVSKEIPIVLDKILEKKYDIIEKIEQHKHAGKERYGIPGFFKEQTIKHNPDEKV